MKIRMGFVSNSSSSSFVANAGIGSLDQIPHFTDDMIHVPQTFGGEYQFGWQNDKYYDFGSKLNWAVMQAYYFADEEKRERAVELIYHVLRNNVADVPVKNNLDTLMHNADDELVYAYIDHQSTTSENPKRQGEIFESAASLENFLFNSNSYIQTSNDNDGYYEDNEDEQQS